MIMPLQSVLHPAGPEADIIAQFAWVLFAGGAVIFVAVMALALLALRRSNRPVSTSWWIAGAGIAFPVAVLTVLLTWSTWRAGGLAAQSSRQPIQIAVTAKMWWWEVRYRDGNGREIASANEIHIPAGQTAYVGISSSDVIHSLWVPALNGKIDAIPGRMTGLTLHAAQPGVYRGQCAEFCGEQHARMALHVVAHAPADYQRWLARQAAPAPAATSAVLQRGRQAFVDQRCGACHTVRGVAEGAVLGPDLTHVGSRLHIAAGTLRNHRGTLAGWIADPQSIKPGARMPAAADIDGETLLALATYLESLK
jgi:cytochrome c oxidase subunit 2